MEGRRLPGAGKLPAAEELVGEGATGGLGRPGPLPAPAHPAHEAAALQNPTTFTLNPEHSCRVQTEALYKGTVAC